MLRQVHDRTRPGPAPPPGHSGRVRQPGQDSVAAGTSDPPAHHASCPGQGAHRPPGQVPLNARGQRVAGRRWRQQRTASAALRRDTRPCAFLARRSPRASMVVASCRASQRKHEQRKGRAGRNRYASVTH